MRRRTGAEQQCAVEPWNGAAEGIAVIVKALLAHEGESGQRAHQTARGREETTAGARSEGCHGAGQQMQVDFGEKKVLQSGQRMKELLPVAC
ncbi:hypothetical protein F0U61_51585 [Archangium violaceum]|uniref:hypothetical protein n=1 Tax=Archangium violaceum TaxID=83451 RepID=UPI002B2CBE7D|nr:hypothetical protein F0U61_51585 [Archangium violaceum]